jgi:8-hydroxy-5-deazaflavin:NADPH oxidoreductase
MTTTTIAIIGAGNVGRALATSARRAGYDVIISSSDPEDAQAVAAATGARVAGSNRDAAAAAGIVVLAVPYPALDGIAAEMADALVGKTVVDVTNRPIQTGPAIAEGLQARLPDAHVVKAFNTAFASRQADPVVDGVAADAFVAGDDAEAKAAVLALAKAIGFRPIDAGGLEVAGTLEGMAWLNISLNMHNGWVWQDAWKLVGPTTAA